MTKEIMNLATKLFKYLPIWAIDKLVLLMCYLVFGDTSKYGLRRPAVGPFTRKLQNNAYPVIDVGTYSKIKSGQIQVLPAMKSIHGDVVEFADGRQYTFDAIIFATGYRSAVKMWLKSEDGLIGEDGTARGRCPKGQNGLYCAGLAGRGIYGSCTDAEFIAQDISKQLQDSANEDSNGI